MSTEPNNTNKTASNVLVILLAVFGLLLLGCVGLSLVIVVCITAIATIGSNANGTFTTVATKVNSPVPATAAAPVGNPQAEQVARQFLDDIGAGRLALARERMTAAGKAVTQGSQQVEIDKHPALKQPKSYSLIQEQVDGRSITMMATVNGRDGTSARMTIMLVNEDGRWLVDNFIIK